MGRFSVPCLCSSWTSFLIVPYFAISLLWQVFLIVLGERIQASLQSFPLFLMPARWVWHCSFRAMSSYPNQEVVKMLLWAQSVPTPHTCEAYKARDGRPLKKDNLCFIQVAFWERRTAAQCSLVGNQPESLNCPCLLRKETGWCVSLYFPCPLWLPEGVALCFLWAVEVYCLFCLAYINSPCFFMCI